MVVDNFPKVEQLVGKYPYPFLHVWVTDLEAGIAGMSRNEFMWLSPTDVDVNTVSHELTHATLYGLFPTWFEEGFAYFIGHRSDGTLQSYERSLVAEMAAVRVPRKLDLTAKFVHSGEVRYILSLAQGFLFFKGLSDIQGVEGLGHVVRALRSKTFNNDNELLRAIVSQQPAGAAGCRPEVHLRQRHRPALGLPVAIWQSGNDGRSCSPSGLSVTGHLIVIDEVTGQRS